MTENATYCDKHVSSRKCIFFVVSSQKPVPVTPTPISEDVNDDDHWTSNQVVAEPRRSTRVKSAPEWYANPILEVMLLDRDEPTNYEEAMMSPDSVKWLEGHEI